MRDIFLPNCFIHFWDKLDQKINSKRHSNSVLPCKWEKILSNLPLNCISVYLFVLSFAMKLRDANYKSHWNSFSYFVTNEKWCQIWIRPMEKCLILFHFYCLGHFSHKMKKFWFWKLLKYFNNFCQKNIMTSDLNTPMVKWLIFFHIYFLGSL